jgi:hypothetical protein
MRPVRPSIRSAVVWTIQPSSQRVTVGSNLRPSIVNRQRVHMNLSPATEVGAVTVPYRAALGGRAT